MMAVVTKKKHVNTNSAAKLTKNVQSFRVNYLFLTLKIARKVIDLKIRYRLFT